MKYILSSKDRDCVNGIWETAKQNLEWEQIEDVRHILKETNFFDNPSEDGASSIVVFYYRVLRLLFFKNSYDEFKVVLNTCIDLECIENTDREDLKEIESLLSQFEQEESNVNRVLIASFIYEILYGEEIGLELLERVLFEHLDMTEELCVRRRLDDFYEELHEDKEKEFENITRIIYLDPHDLNLFKKVADDRIFDFYNIEKYWDLLEFSIRANIDNFEYWQYIPKMLYNLDTVEKVFELYLKLGQPIIPCKKAVIGLTVFSAITKWKLIDSYQIIDKQRNSLIWDSELELIWMKYKCFKFNKNDYANKSFKAKLEQAIGNDEYLYNIAKTYYELGLYKKTLRSLELISPNSSLGLNTLILEFGSYIKLGNYELAEESFRKNTPNGIPKETILWILDLMRYRMAPEEIIDKILTNIELIEGDRKEAWFNDEKIFKKILDNTSHIENNGVLRRNIWLLFNRIGLLKYSLKYKCSNEAIFHYTKIDTITNLAEFRGRKAGKFRLSNVAYMNDPAEGKSFFEALKLTCPKDAKEKLDIMLSQLYGKEQFLFRNTYLTSFSLNKDFLPMWVQYGDNGNGCCLHIECNVFGDYDESIPERFIPKNEMFNLAKLPVLYKVYYFDCELNDDTIRKNLEQITKSLLSIHNYMGDENIAEMVTGLLDEVRYLFKSTAYETENEIRLIQSDFEEKAILVNSAAPGKAPKLYLELGENFHFQEVMLGPRVNNIREWSAFLGNCTNVDKVSKSSIQYE